MFYYTNIKGFHLIKNILLSSLLFATTAFAFDTRTHVWIAQEVINDLNDSKVTIEPFGEFDVAPSIVEAITKNQKVFRMGNIGPDGFPDVVAGQVTVHPGLEDGTIDDGSEIFHGWKSDEWFEWVINKAQTPEEKAFAYGFLLHGAADTFAHTYVNMYTGDIFDMNDGETDVEKRHIFLEKFISDRLPPMKDANGVTIGNSWDVVAVNEELPVSFIKSTLLMNEEVATQYALSGTASYLTKMYEFREKIAALTDKNTEATVEADLAKADDECDTRWYPGKYLLSIFASKDEACDTKDYLTAKLNKIKSFNVPTYSFKQAWLDKIDGAIDAYIMTSSRMSQEFMRVNGDSYGQLTDWMTCYSSAFTDPTTALSTATQKTCKFSSKLEEKLSFLNDVKAKTDFTALSGLKSKVNKLTATAGNEIVSLIGVAALEIVLVKEKPVSEADLNKQFGKDTSDKNLLLINDIAQRVKLEMAVNMNGELNPKRFYPLYNAVVLAKLALLSPEQLNELISRANDAGEYTYEDEQNYSLLFHSIKTIDGNHQWLRQAPPYPRTEGNDDTVAHLYGYENDNVNGFHLFETQKLRKDLFSKIFKGPLSLGLETPEVMGFDRVLASNYPYVTCEKNPFPNGVEDKECLIVYEDPVVVDPKDDNTTVTDPVTPEPKPQTTWYDDLVSYLKKAVYSYFNSLVPAKYQLSTTETEDSVTLETKVPDTGIEF